MQQAQMQTRDKYLWGKGSYGVVKIDIVVNGKKKKFW